MSEPAKISDDPRPAFFKWTGFVYAKHVDIASKYRALRTLAILANDHIRETEFFANEMRARRFWFDQPLGRGCGRFWLGWFYDTGSNFGRSLWRPVLAWMFVQCAAAIVYFGVYAFEPPTLNPPRWKTDACLNGQGSAISETLILTVINSVPQTGTSTERAKSAQACLFGVETDKVTSIGLFQFPTIALLGSILQTIGSLTSLFLIGLAIRNSFKIH